MDDHWAALLRYKLAEDKLNDLKRKVWKEMPFDAQVKVTLAEAEQELEEIKDLIHLNHETIQGD